MKFRLLIMMYSFPYFVYIRKTNRLLLRIYLIGSYPEIIGINTICHQNAMINQYCCIHTCLGFQNHFNSKYLFCLFLTIPFRLYRRLISLLWYPPSYNDIVKYLIVRQLHFYGKNVDKETKTIHKIEVTFNKMNGILKCNIIEMQQVVSF